MSFVSSSAKLPVSDLLDEAADLALPGCDVDIADGVRGTSDVGNPRDAFAPAPPTAEGDLEVGEPTRDLRAPNIPKLVAHAPDRSLATDRSSDWESPFGASPRASGRD